MIRFGLVFSLVLQAILVNAASAHELRPAYLNMQELAPNEFSVLWRVPALGDMRLGLDVRLPKTCRPQADSTKSIEGSAYVERWIAMCAEGLDGKEILIEGLRSTMTDALARVEYRDGFVEVARLTPEQPGFTVAGAHTGWQVAGAYAQLGVLHILSGLDHLLFVFALILLIQDRWMLVRTITAFTLAHSITLAGAALGYFGLPQQPVEATIALSIAFVASELAKARPGEKRRSGAYPLVIAFAFGLVHGFGFAGALKEIGLPQSDIPLALLTFNLGVEAGQLLFVAAMLAVLKFIGLVVAKPLGAARVAAAYMIGTVAMVWFIDRLGGFLI